MITKSHIAIAVGLLIAFAVIIFIALIVIFKFLPNSGSFAGFGEKGYRGLDPGIHVHPLVEFYYKNRELRKGVDAGTVQIEAVYMVYKSFINAPGLEQVPRDIMIEATKIANMMEEGRDFTITDTPDFRKLGMAITGMDRLLVMYLESLSLSKNKVGGTDPNQENMYNDYIRVGSLNSGYIDGVLSVIDVDGIYGDDHKAAKKMKDDITEQIGLQLQLGQSDPLRYAEESYDYQNNLSERMHGGKMLSAKEKYKDRRFPGTFERKQLRDEPTYKPEKDYKDPNVPRFGIIGKVADVPYEYDVHAKNFVRSF